MAHALSVVKCNQDVLTDYFQIVGTVEAHSTQQLGQKRDDSLSTDHGRHDLVISPPDERHRLRQHRDDLARVIATYRLSPKPASYRTIPVGRCSGRARGRPVVGGPTSASPQATTLRRRLESLKWSHCAIRIGVPPV
ncbi:hypothetical protein [Ralstonia sp. GP101]|uniref:hypothetical protein n=1 Tax=Ralstonia sp. GP101 TaxID=3035146 RepID=UPI0038915669